MQGMEATEDGGRKVQTRLISTVSKPIKVVVVVVFYVVVVDPRNLPLKFCQNWVSNSCHFLVVIHIVVMVVVDPRNLPSKSGQNWVSIS